MRERERESDEEVDDWRRFGGIDIIHDVQSIL